VIKAVLTYVHALIGFLRKIVTSVHGYEQHKVHVVYVDDANSLHLFFNRNVTGEDAKHSAIFLLQKNPR
jgi:hypothetical protein